MKASGRGGDNAAGAVWRIALYLRLSREDGNDESLSITNQRSILREYVEESFGEPYTIVDEYIDDGKTGTDIARAEFKRMIGDVEAGRVNCVIVKDLKRFMRNHGYQALYLEQIFPKNDTRFITVSEPRLDTYRDPNAVYGFDVPMHGIMNDRYAKGTSEAVKRTFATKIKQGQFIGAFCPYGYMKDPADKNRLVIDDEAARIVRLIFKWFLEGASKRAICARLKEYGVPNPTRYKRSKGLSYNNPHAAVNDGLWNPTTVARLLKNEAYVGTMVQGKQRVVNYKIHDKIMLPQDEWVKVPGAQPAVIGAEQFAKAQAMLAKNTRVTKQAAELTLLAGFVRCYDCKKAMRRKVGGNAAVAYYVCRSYNEKRVCSSHTIRASVLENAVLEAIKAQIALIPDIRGMIARLGDNSAPHARLDAMIGDKRKELEKLGTISDDLYLDWKKGFLEANAYLRLQEKTGRQLEQLREAVERMEEERGACGGTAAHPVFEALKRASNIEELDRAVLAALVDVIYVHENKEITIVFRYSDSVSIGS